MNILLLGGTSEASALARRLNGDPRFRATLSLAGRTQKPAKAPIPQRVGGFGGIEGLAGYLTGEGVDLLIDATHPLCRADVPPCGSRRRAGRGSAPGAAPASLATAER